MGQVHVQLDDYKCYMHKDNKRVEIFRKGRIIVLKLRRRWLESKAHMVATIDEVADGRKVQMSQETIHHHHDLERYDQVQYDQEQKW